jgi:UDP-2,3-diacylglucosamine pyrophosphatase LpxH
VRTLVISDVHLGQGGGISVLTRPRPLAKLLEALDQHDRLVLLGDTVEMQESHPAQAFPVAEPVMRAVAEHLGEDKQVLIVPGNHDHELVREWARAAGPGLLRENLVPTEASERLRELVSWFDATQVEVHYPGVWLADGVWATHGHYLNHYLRPVSSYGLYRGGTNVAPASPQEIEYYADDHAGPPHLRDGMLPERWIDRHIPNRLAPLSSWLLDRQMQRHALPAMLGVVRALDVRDAEWVIFGHVHRRGPRPRDDAAHWSGADGRPGLLNTGSWRYEPVVVRGLDGDASYWPGGAVSIGDDGVPHSVGLLEELSERELVAVI